MLRFLKIRDFALIRELEIELDQGLNLLTGETGSGKSIIVDALALLLGERPCQEMIRTGADTAVVEGIFRPGCREEVAGLLEGAGLDSCDEDLIIRRELSASGRNRIFVNNGPATTALLRSIGAYLADIHGQQDRQALLDGAAHLEWLDRFGGNGDARAGIRDRFRRARKIAEELVSLRMDEAERLRRVDMLEFQSGEIERADPQPEEWDALRSERSILSHREKVFSLSNEAYALLYESEASLLVGLNRLARVLRELGSFDSSWGARSEILQESIYRLDDLALAVRDYASRFDFSPERMEQVERRLSELERLLQKYGPGLQDVLAYRDRCRSQLFDLRTRDDRSRELSARLEEALRDYARAAEELSAKRRKDAALLEHGIRAEFQALAMERMELGVRFLPRAAPGAGETIPADYGPSGVDHIEFMATPNEGEEAKPLNRIASGGELSRVMLAIRSVCRGAETGRTLVFDEVDAGIGGRVAEAVGRRLQGLSRGSQVLCVTHLAQIAAFADAHYRVRKELVGTRTETFVERLGSRERIEELARMLGGEVITERARAHAREMTVQARAAGQALTGKQGAAR